VITDSPRGVGQIWPDIEDERSNNQPNGLEHCEESTHSSCKIAACAQRIGQSKCDDTKAYQAERDEGVIDPKQSSDKLRQRSDVCSQVNRFRHQQSGAHQSKVQQSGDLEGESQIDFHVVFQVAPRA